MFRTTLSAFFAGVILLRVASPADADPGPYTFTVIAETDDTFSFAFQTPSINNSGEVAFVKFATAGGAWLMSGDGATLTVMADNTGEFATFGEHGRAPIADSGAIACKATLDDGGQGIFRFEPSGDVTPIADIADFGGGAFDSIGISINNASTVAFHHLYSGVYLGAGGTPTFVDAGDAPSVDTVAQVAYVGLFDFAPSVLRKLGDDVDLIAGGSTSLNQFHNPCINEGGQVAFWANFYEGPNGIFIGSGGELTTVADTGGPYAALSDPSLNDLGEVAFLAVLDEGLSSGIYTGPDPESDKVIAQGDPLVCSTVSLLYICRESLNNSGQIAFLVYLADGRGLIVRADPAGESGPCGDIDGDNDRDLADLDLFISILLGSDATACQVDNADLNGDGAVDGNDIQPMADCILVES